MGQVDTDEDGTDAESNVRAGVISSPPEATVEDDPCGHRMLPAAARAGTGALMAIESA